MTFDSANLYFHVAFVPGTFDINDYRFVLHLDADQDPGTGLNPVGIGSTLRDDIGLDFYVASDTMPSSSFGGPGFAKVYAPHVGVVDEVSFAYGMDFLSFSVPLSSLGNDDGVVNYVFSAADSIKDNFVTNADHVPNTGLGVSTGTNASSTPDIEVKDSIVPIDDAQMPFGSLNEGTRSAPEILSIRNNGTGDLLIQDMMVTGNDAQDFDVNMKCSVEVIFAPQTPGAKGATITVSSDDADQGVLDVALGGLAVSSAVNNPPDVPRLVYPANGEQGLGTAVRLKWQKCSDPEGDPVTYHVSISEHAFLASADAVKITSPAERAVPHGRSVLGLVVFGLFLAGGARNRKRLFLLVTAMLIIAALAASCGGGGADATGARGEITLEMSGLSAGTTYYWKVTAEDGAGNSVSSEVRNFTTD
jgi:hypothetical protein